MLRGADLSPSTSPPSPWQSAFSTHAATSIALTSQLTALQATTTALEGTIASQTLAVSRAEAGERTALARVEQVEDELRLAETVRRKLHNQVQELKGNIRVFARVRPALRGCRHLCGVVERVG